MCQYSWEAPNTRTQRRTAQITSAYTLSSSPGSKGTTAVQMSLPPTRHSSLYLVCQRHRLFSPALSHASRWAALGLSPSISGALDHHHSLFLGFSTLAARAPPPDGWNWSSWSPDISSFEKTCLFLPIKTRCTADIHSELRGWKDSAKGVSATERNDNVVVVQFKWDTIWFS